MRKSLFLCGCSLILCLFVVLPLAGQTAAADTSSQPVQIAPAATAETADNLPTENSWLGYLETMLTAVIVWFLGKFVHIKIKAETVQGLTSWAIGLMVQANKLLAGKTGAEKKQYVIDQLEAGFADAGNKFLTQAKRSLLQRLFGSLDNFVEHVFQNHTKLAN